MAERDMGWLTVSEAWRVAWPGAAVGFLAMEDVSNPAQHDELDERKAALEAELRERFAGSTRADLRVVEPLPAYSAYYRGFGKTYHVQLQLESVALKGRSLPSVAALVEAVFMTELRNLLLTAVHDLSALALPIRLDVARGDETYELLNENQQTLTAGDMYLADGEGVISSILHGPDRRTRVTPETHEVVCCVYAPSGVGAPAVARHLDDLAENIRVVAPGARIAAREVVGGG
jgi:DNA/RNA-binding domain of Phe-tRNA-synthetase-like protein